MENLKQLRSETIKKLEEVKENLRKNDNETNYCNMINTLIDYDNEAQDNLYLSDRYHELLEIVDEELIQYYLENQFKSFGMERAAYIFAGINYSDSIYKINTYGNLENVTDKDFRICIDEMLEILKNAIESEDKENE